MTQARKRPLTLTFPDAPGYMLIPDAMLERHICDIWYIADRWDQWPMARHVIAGAHDLYYIAGLILRSPLLQELEFLRELADTRRAMAQAQCEPTAAPSTPFGDAVEALMT